MDSRDTIQAEIERELEGTQYSCSKLYPLRGGSANFLFRGVLRQPLPDATAEVVIKHGEDYVAANPGFKLSASRCLHEKRCLEALSGLPPVSSTSYLVQTPRLIHFNPSTNTQILELLPDAVDLKTYALSHLTYTQEDVQAFARDIGYGVGRWLRQFHDWAADPARSELRADIQLNVDMQSLKNRINYTNLVSKVDKFPDILENSKQTFEQVRDLALAELANVNELQVIHGDFWTGNALLPNKPSAGGSQSLIFITDWELCQLGVKPLDLGQMIAEMYELYLFKGIQAGISLIDGFAAGYGDVGDDFAFRTAIHVGTHLICWGSTVAGWGTDEQIRDVVAKGNDLITKAWQQDRAWFIESDLACLFRKKEA